MTLRRGEPTSIPVQNVQAVQSVQALTSVFPRDAGEDEGGGLNDWNFLNEWNVCQGRLPRSGEHASRSLLHVRDSI